MLFFGEKILSHDQISNVNGKIIYTFTCKNKDIDITPLNPGIYPIKLKGKKQFIIQKFIKI